MSRLSESDEDMAFQSLSVRERRTYFERLRENGGDVSRALDTTIGRVWFDEDRAPKGHRRRSQGE